MRIYTPETLPRPGKQLDLEEYILNLNAIYREEEKKERRSYYDTLRRVSKPH